MMRTRKYQHHDARIATIVGMVLLVAVSACGTAPPPVSAIPTLTLGPTVAPPPTLMPTATLVPTPTATAPRPTPGIPTDLQGFAQPAFHQLWDQSDRDIALGRVSRSWLWGPQPFAVRREPYAQAPDGTRLVQYFDKSRMEINDPDGNPADPWFVTNGLLTSEMVTGRVQVGLDTFEVLEPADVPVTGDLESPDHATPRYADFAPVASVGGGNRATAQIGTPIATRFAHGGAIDQLAKPPATVKVGAY